MNYEQILNQFIAESAKRGEQVQPMRLLNQLDKLQNPIAQVCETDIENLLYEELRKEYNFIHSLQQQNTTPYVLSLDNRNKFIGLIRWLWRSVEQFRHKKPTDKQLIAYLFTASFLSAGNQMRIFWRKLPIACLSSQEFLNKLCELIKNSKSSFLISRYGQRHFVGDIYKKYENADMQANFFDIVNMHLYLENIIMPNTLFYQAVICLAYLDFNRLVNLSHNIQQTIPAFAVAKILPQVLRFRLSAQSQSQWIQFWCLYGGIKNISKGKSCEGKKWKGYKHHYLVLSLKRLANHQKCWKQTMLVFNTYPHSYPVLQEALGEALVHVSNSARLSYISSIELNMSMRGRQEVGRCVKKFLKYSDVVSRQFFLSKCYERWETFFNGEEVREDRYHKVPLLTNLDYAIVAYLLEFKNKEIITICIQELFDKLVSLTSTWHESKNNLITAYNLIISRMQPYFRVLSIINNKDIRYLVNSYQLPGFIGCSAYYRMLFEQRAS